MNTFLINIKSNWRAGLTVSLVSLPLSISLAVAANATPVMKKENRVFESTAEVLQKLGFKGAR